METKSEIPSQLNSQPSGKAKRLFLGHFSHPKVQIKYALLTSSIVSFGVTLSNLFLIYRMNTIMTETETGASSTCSFVFLQLLYSMLSMGLSTLFSTFLLTFSATIVITHRFLGPIINIKNHIDAISRNQKPMPLKFRKDDELHEVANYLNELNSKLGLIQSEPKA